MPARWMQPKLIKIKRQRRAWARPLSVKSGIRPNRDVIRQYQETAKGLGVEIARTIYPNVAPGRAEIMARVNNVYDTLYKVARDIRDPFVTNIVCTPVHRCDVFWNSKMDTFILRWIQWRKQVYHISIAYPSFAVANDRWATDKVRWRIHDSPFPTRT